MTLTVDDICLHTPQCECMEWMYVTVPDYNTYYKASSWLRDIRKYKLICVDGEYEGPRLTGAFRFKFLCQQECIWFILRWS